MEKHYNGTHHYIVIATIVTLHNNKYPAIVIDRYLGAFINSKAEFIAQLCVIDYIIVW